MTTRAGLTYKRRSPQRGNNLQALGLAVCSPHLSPPLLCPAPPASFAFDEFLAYFLAESLGHVLAVAGGSDKWNL